jgi:hypothetical protein
VEKQIALINDDRVKRSYTGTWRATLGGKEIATGQVSGKIASATNRFEPVAIDLPASVSDAARR